MSFAAEENLSSIIKEQNRELDRLRTANAQLTQALTDCTDYLEYLGRGAEVCLRARAALAEGG